MKEDIQVRSNEAQREIRKKEKLEKECKQIRSEMESKNNELKAKTTQLQRSQEENLRMEQQLKEQRVILIMTFFPGLKKTILVFAIFNSSVELA